MRTFLLCSAIHGKTRALAWLRHLVQTRKPDVLLFAGGVLDPARQLEARPGANWGMVPDDSRFLEQFFTTLGALGVCSIVIPGAADIPLEQFLQIGMQAELDSPGVHLAHATLIEKADCAICGMGGLGAIEVATDSEKGFASTSGMDSYSRVLTEYHLRSLWTARQPHKILLLDAPPLGLLGGAHGHEFIGELINTYHPGLCVVAGAFENLGMQRIASTVIVNPGTLAEGSAAWLDWSRPGDAKVEFLNLRAEHHGTDAFEEVGSID